MSCDVISVCHFSMSLIFWPNLYEIGAHRCKINNLAGTQATSTRWFAASSSRPLETTCNKAPNWPFKCSWNEERERFSSWRRFSQIPTFVVAPAHGLEREFDQSLVRKTSFVDASFCGRPLSNWHTNTRHNLIQSQFPAFPS